jgi:uncharacterized protein YjlB
MTALALTEVPSDINTYERMLVWCAQALSSAANGKTVNVAPGEANQVQATVNHAPLADDRTYFIVNAYIPYDVGDLNSSAQKTWMAAQDITNAAPHVNFNTN